MAKEVLTFCCLVLYLLVIGVESRSTHPSSIPTTPTYSTKSPGPCHVYGGTYQAGKTFKLTRCIYCYCEGDDTDNPYWCYDIMCETLHCDEVVRPPGACCWTCVDDIYCYTPWGEIMQGTLFNETLGLECVCDPSLAEYGYHDPDTYEIETLPATCSPRDDQPH